jgi:predicted porin
VAGSIGNSRYRTDNAVNYLSPNLGGFTLNAQYSFQFDGAEQNKPNDKSGRHFGISGLYKGGPFQVGAAYLEMTDTSLATLNDQKQKGYLVYGGMTFGGFTAKLAYDRTDNDTAKDKQIIGASLEAPLGPVNLAFGVAQSKDTTGLANVDDDAWLANVQVVYDLSKRTAIYTFYTHVKNDTSTALGFNGPVADKNSNLFQVGIRHRF